MHLTPNKLLLLLLGAGLATTASADLDPFTTDGCSAFPDGTTEQQQLWHNCCVVHDLAYWQGGSRLDRKEADQALEDCVANVGEPMIANLMLAGVTVGGTPYLPTRFRWGYGWPYLRGYKVLSVEEVEEVHKKSADALKTVQDHAAGEYASQPQ